MNFVFANDIMISTNQIAHFKRSAVFLKMKNRLAYFQSHKIKDWLVNIIRTKHDQ